MTRIKQTRNKITWYTTIVLTIFGLITFFLMYKNPEKIADLTGTISVLILNIMAIVGFYQASEGYTKGKFIDKANNINEIKE